MTRLGDVVEHLKTFKVKDSPSVGGASCPFYSCATDIEDVLEELAEPGCKAGRELAGGVQLRGINLAHIVRLGLEETIKAHSVVEGQRQSVRDEAARKLQARRDRIASSGYRVRDALDFAVVEEGKSWIEFFAKRETLDTRCQLRLEPDGAMLVRVFRDFWSKWNEAVRRSDFDQPCIVVDCAEHAE